VILILQFQHATSKYKSNIDYATATELEYGQVNPTIKPTNAKEFKVETNFSLVPVLIQGTSGTLTHYGFTNDTPEIIETGETRYTPNFGELTFFILMETSSYKILLVLKVRNSGVFINSILDSHIKVVPWNIENDSLPLVY
jgi:hypothetical protein